ncbi:ABC transporter ATP-binding protein [Amaricoccus solimangrovi]|uniref:ABC transporter ATP-binding protein n=1 Tax=Amaricoccus solimangrovi TaxID=2589815 RepID=A0A501WHN1_9RHOB|nr:ABC transporter ATP-binding protein [Amaricoccus solimangrovi]TPE49393.1 ABC transporter ATP-binding protein [Amaricoccus solimangrovi]
MPSIVSIEQVRKTYATGLTALHAVDLRIEEGEILALLGPNGAGKTTLISMTCGISSITSGRITVGGHDVARDFRAARRMIGLVPQELTIEIFEKVIDTVRFTRGLFGMPPDEDYIRRLLTRLSLWEKRDARIRELSGGMKRRVLIAKALAHQPRVLFLDEPTAGVDVDLRRDMWEMIDELRGDGTTVVLTTHYIEEAEAIADRIGVINRGRILLVEEKETLMRRMGRKQLTIELAEPLGAVPAELASYNLELGDEGRELVYAYDKAAERTGIASLLAGLTAAGIRISDLRTAQDTLEDIFVHLVRAEDREAEPEAADPEARAAEQAEVYP